MQKLFTRGFKGLALVAFALMAVASLSAFTMHASASSISSSRSTVVAGAAATSRRAGDSAKLAAVTATGPGPSWAWAAGEAPPPDEPSIRVAALRANRRERVLKEDPAEPESPPNETL